MMGLLIALVCMPGFFSELFMLLNEEKDHKECLILLILLLSSRILFKISINRL
jgi:hypothetical protein